VCVCMLPCVGPYMCKAQQQAGLSRPSCRVLARTCTPACACMGTTLRRALAEEASISRRFCVPVHACVGSPPGSRSYFTGMRLNAKVSAALCLRQPLVQHTAQTCAQHKRAHRTSTAYAFARIQAWNASWQDCMRARKKAPAMDCLEECLFASTICTKQIGQRSICSTCAHVECAANTHTHASKHIAQ